jgi:predicted molibdopterin-dependent oxidoreductase YjgC
MLDAAADGRLKAMWIDRHEPTTISSQTQVSTALERLEFVVVQHLFLTETARHADVVLPLVAFGEERVTFTNTERRIQVADKVIEPPRGPLPAWDQIARVANHLGARWAYGSSAQVMDEIREAVPFYAGASHDNLTRDYGRQWPCTADRPLGTERLFAGDDERRQFKVAALAWPDVAGSCMIAGYPFALILGHSLYYWHQNVLVQHSETLRREYRVLLLDYPEGFVDINGDDARELGVRDGGRIRLVTTKGDAVTTARVTREIKRGMVFVPYFLHDVIQRIAGDGDGVAGSADLPICARVERA